MKLLLDTHAFLWYVAADAKLTEKAKMAIQDTGNIKFISIASFWEIVIKTSLGKLQLNSPFENLYKLKGYHHLAISFLHLENLTKLEFHHGDPFDRLIIAQAKVEKMHIISIDESFDKYGIKRIW
jgi:PIN domain nuclease of toxin-antitoxin system